MSSEQDTERAPKLFLPSLRASLVLAALGIVALSAALFLRYGIIQNSVIGVACEAGEVSLICKIRLAVLLMFIQDLFGWAPILAAGVNLWRPITLASETSLILALLGLVLYNPRASALAIALLVLSLARPVRAGR